MPVADVSRASGESVGEMTKAGDGQTLSEGSVVSEDNGGSSSAY